MSQSSQPIEGEGIRAATPTGAELALIDAKLDNVHTTVPNFTDREIQIMRRGLVRVGGRHASGGSIPTKGAFELVKQAAIEKGYCYLMLLLACPALATVDESSLLSIIEEVKREHGKFPVGQTILPTITAANLYLNGTADLPFNVVLQQQRDSEKSFIESLRQLMLSPVRMQYKVIDDVLHLSTDLEEPCSCNEDVLCDHGFYMKMIFSLVTIPEYRVGGDLNVDFSALFVDVNEEAKAVNSATVEDCSSSEDLTVLPLNQRKINQQKQRRDSAIQIEDSEEDNESLNRAMRTIDAVSRRRRNSDRIDEELRPEDSSSVLNRYTESRKFMRSGTILSMCKEEPSQDLIYIPQGAQANHINGFMLTKSIREADLESRNKINVINGLAQPFVRKRLNLLTHIHTAIETSKFFESGELLTIFKSFKGYTPTSPTELLFSQLVERTFDFRDMVVISNPFDLPFLELGMLVSEMCLRKTVDLMYKEFEMKWFHEMKNLRVPLFSSKYNSLSEGYLANKRKGEETDKPKRPQGGGKHYYERKKASSKTSFLGL